MILENIPLFNTCIISPAPSPLITTNPVKSSIVLETGEDEVQPDDGTDNETDKDTKEEPAVSETNMAEDSTDVVKKETVKGVRINEVVADDGEDHISAKNSIIENESETIDSLGLVELNMEHLSGEESISLKKPTEVYEEIYREARRKAIEAKKFAISAYLTANRIKELYSLDEILDSDEDDLSDTEIQKLET